MAKGPFLSDISHAGVASAGVGLALVVGVGGFDVGYRASLCVFVNPVGAPSIAVQPPSTRSAVPVM